MTRRDLLLQQMGIAQWQLHRPNALKGAVQITVAGNVRFIVIAEQEINLQSRLFHDILATLQLSENQALYLNFEQAQHLNLQQEAALWLLSDNPEKIDRTLAQLSYKKYCWQSPDWQEFCRNAHAKRELWQQMQLFLTQSESEN